MIHDGLWCPFENWHMGNTGEVVAEKHQITREVQDDFAYNSHRKAHEAHESGRFKLEIVPVEIPQKKAIRSCWTTTKPFERILQSKRFQS
jgi:acetyl-CoA C-acetyltransferase